MVVPNKLSVAMAIAVLASSGCAGLASHSGPTGPQTTAEAQREDQQAKQIERSVGLAGSIELQAYISEIGQRLVAESTQSDVTYTFAIVDIDAVNAFALPGGHIYVSRGLLTLANNEAELANVMAHEIAHVVARHSLKQARREVLLSPLQLAGGIAGGIAGAAASILSPSLGGVLAEAGGMAGGLVLAKYSRDQEREADRIGQRMVLRAGWDPVAMSSFLASLRREDAFERGGLRGSSFFDSHPDTSERVETTARFAEELNVDRSGYQTGRARLFAHIDGLLLETDPRLGVFVGRDFFHPRRRLAITFPSGWVRQRARSHVAVFQPGGMAYMLLTFVGEGDDAMVAASLARRQFSFDLDDVRRTRINGLSAARLSTQVVSTQGPVSVEIAWVVLEAQIYQISSAAPAVASVGYHDQLLKVINSVRCFEAGDALRIGAKRLRIVQARAGESLERLLDRSAALWSPGRASVFNAIPEGTSLGRGRAVKVAVEEPYLIYGASAQ